jgi:AraC-like DNA-binding protein
MCHADILYDRIRNPLPLNRLGLISGYQAFFVLQPASREQHKHRSFLHLEDSKLSYAEDLIRKMRYEQTRMAEGFDIALLKYLIGMMLFLSREYSHIKMPVGQGFLKIGKALGLMESQYERQWHVDELAKIANMSRASFMRTFRAVLGVSPIDYLIGLRVNRAKELLVLTSGSITEIAFEVGFTDSNYFSRQFKKVTSLTPRQYRKNRGADGRSGGPWDHGGAELPTDKAD